MKEKKRNKNRIILVDGNALAFRSLFAHEQFSTNIDDEVIYTGLIFGFVKTLIHIKKRYDPKYFIVFWDGGAKRKKEIYPDYKKGRKFKTKNMNFDDVITSLDYCKKILQLDGIPQYRVFGEEGDDIIASYIAQNPGPKYFILSNDHDMFQMIAPGTVVIRMKHGDTKLWNIKAFIAEYGFQPKYYPHYLAFVGDTTDNIPGAKGLGKIAVKNIFSQFVRPTVNNVYAAREYIKMTPKIKEKLESAQEDVKTFLKITQLKRDIELVRLNGRKQKPKRLLSLLRDLKFRSIYRDPETMTLLLNL